MLFMQKNNKEAGMDPSPRPGISVEKPDCAALRAPLVSKSKACRGLAGPDQNEASTRMLFGQAF